ncbi:MAG TPA: DEAD/DEAH box helicase [Patescibacteria group bacterium]|nr:DEAD/DEAH box helicase [Patescibacteria group bacterium]
MYNHNRNNQSFRHSSGGRRNDSQRRFQGNHRNNQKRNETKKLDAHLFVKKAALIIEQPAVVSSASFSDYAISDALKTNIATHGYTTPTPIQEKAIPYLLAQRDVIGTANTGAGKTAAFLIPIIDKIDKNRNQRVLIIVPTRELAMQIIDEFHQFAQGMNLKAVLCIGGANMQRQQINLTQNPSIVVGTPGRLKDLANRRKLHLMQFGTIVLDEVDRMVDIGFIKDIQYLISLLPEIRQSLFFSATVSGKTKEILENFVTNPVNVSVKHQEAAVNIDQDVIQVKNPSMKLDTLHDLLVKEEFNKVLVFGRTKWGIEKLTKALIARGFKAAAIHGNKSQGQRQRALQMFKENQVQILLATDVASRGLDIDDVTHVINYDAPTSYDDYVHRIGRTGRAGKKGVALTFID